MSAITTLRTLKTLAINLILSLLLLPQSASLILNKVISLHQQKNVFVSFREHRRDTHSLFQQAGSEKSDIPFDLTAFNTEQFELFKTNQIGRWIGVHAGYDPENEDVADYIYTETLLEEVKNSDGSAAVRHVNSFVLGEIRTDCEVCFDSDRVKSKEIGMYSIGKTRARSCGNCELRGPSPTPRGMSSEISLRHADGRVRLLLAYEPLEWTEIDKMGQVPSSMLLRDIVIVRERLGKRPLELEIDPDVMWHKTSDTVFDGQFQGYRNRVSSSGLTEKLRIGPQGFPTLYSMDLSKEENGDENIYSRSFPGGIAIEAPLIVDAGLSCRTHVSWMPSAGVSEVPGLTYSAEFAFTALEVDRQGIAESGTLRLSPPRVTDFFVDALEPSDYLFLSQ